MKRVEEFLRFAKECRDMATIGLSQHRRELIRMAETWEALARERRERIDKGKESKPDDTRH